MLNPTSQSVVAHNQQIYQQLKLALSLHLRRQLFIAVCDNINLRNQLAVKLHAELSEHEQGYGPDPGHDQRACGFSQSSGQLVSLMLDCNDPNPVGQIAVWLQEHPQSGLGGQAMLGFQILGLELLTRQPSTVQRLFLTYLRTIDRNLPRLNCSLLIWVNRPWGYMIRQSAPECWNWCTGIFEFASDPVPLLSPVFEANVQSKSLSPLEAEQIEQNVGLSDSPANSADQEWVLTGQLNQYSDFLEILAKDLAQLDGGGTEGAGLKPGNNAAHDGVQRGTDYGTDPGFGNGSPTTDAHSHKQFEKLEPDSGHNTSGHNLPQDFHPIVKHNTVEQTASGYGSLEQSSLNYIPLGQTRFDKSAGHNGSEPSLPIGLGDGGGSNTGKVATATVAATEAKSYLKDSELTHTSQLDVLQARIEQLRHEQAPLSTLAEAHLNLGRYYRNRIEQGDVIQTILAGGIAAYEQVLEWLCFSEVSPEEIGDVAWSDILNDLGTLYWMASRSPEQLENSVPYLRQAVQAYQLGLKKISEIENPRSYAMLQNNLGTVYSDLAHYSDTLNNLNNAIVAYRIALKYRRPDTDPLKFAATQNNLGTAHWHLAQHKNPIENLQQAIAAYNQSLRFYRPEQEPISYAMIQNNLGTAYWNLAQHVEESGIHLIASPPTVSNGDSKYADGKQIQSKDWLLLAVNAYQCALRFRTLETSPNGYAATQNNLGTAYWHLAHQSQENHQTRREYLKLSIQAYEAALDAAERLNYRDQATSLSFDLFATHNNLGLAHYQVATDQGSDDLQPAEERHLKAALQHHVQALLGWKHQPDFYQTAMSYVVQTIRCFYEQWGTSGQNRALAQVPGHLLPEILGKL